MTEKIYDAIIIGGGASGLTVASVAKNRGKNILVIEANKRVGRKILLAGNGKCNISNEKVSAENYNNPFVEKFLEKSYKVAEFFQTVGIVTRTLDGRIYPYTESGNTVLNLLRKDLSDDIVTEEKVEEICFSDGVFSVNGRKAKKVVLCTGGITSGGINSYFLLKKFGHVVTPLYPVLTPLKSDVKYTKALAGIRAKVKLSLLCDGKRVYAERGELLFKENGLSGIVSMGLSRHINPNGNYSVSIDFAPDFDLNELPNINAEGLLQRAVLSAVERQAKDRNIHLVKAMKDFIVNSVKSGDTAVAQVTRGGLSTEQFDETLESKLKKGIFACGEVLDVDGECGGYNLHWAFLSAIIVGENL